MRVPSLKLRLKPGKRQLKWHRLYERCALCYTGDPTRPMTKFEGVVPGHGPACKRCYNRWYYRAHPEPWIKAGLKKPK